MMGAVIRNGDNTLVVELPTGTMDLQLKLHSIGIAFPADAIPISDEDGDALRVGILANPEPVAGPLPCVGAAVSLC